MDPTNECRPGGSCPTCNPPPAYCPECGDVRVDEAGTVCDACFAPKCAWCGEMVDEEQKYCSVGCARADHAEKA